jgi:phosphatidylserine/phosphatidylglycerophosphate/cardiolipin synthase-like enzyme
LHDKITMVDGMTVATGSFNYSASAENRNAENLLVIHDLAPSREYIENWNARAARSRPSKLRCVEKAQLWKKSRITFQNSWGNP